MNSRNQSQYSNMSQTTTEQSAIKTLEKLGYTWQGGELWKPPLGANPSPPLTKIDQLQAEVEALRKDAARYQWLRRMSVGLSLSHQVISQFVTNQGELDAVIAKDTQENA